MKMRNVGALTEFFGGEVPRYVTSAGKSYLNIRIGSEWGGVRVVKIRMKDVAEYCATEVGSLLSGCRTLAGIVGDWRPIDALAKMALGWFIYINPEGMRKALMKWGLEPKF